MKKKALTTNQPFIRKCTLLVTGAAAIMAPPLLSLQLNIAQATPMAITNQNQDSQQNSENRNNQYSQSNSRPMSNTSQDEPHLWNLRDADIRAVIAAVSKATGKNFIIDPRVTGRISIVSNRAISTPELYHVFLSMLEVSGFTAVTNGSVIKIIPNQDARHSSTQVVNGAHPGSGDENVVRVIPIKHVSATELVPSLRPLLPQWSSISAYAPSNTLIISGQASNLTRIANIIDQVDNTSQLDVDIVPLKYAQADDVVQTIQDLQKDPARHVQMTRLSADTRSNSILMSGGASDRIRTRVLISQLDTPATNHSDNTRVIYLRYMHAVDLVPILAGVARSNYDGPVGTVVGSRQDDPKFDNRGDMNGPSDYNSAGDMGDMGGDINMRRAGPGMGNDGQVNTTPGKSRSKPPIEIIGEPNTNSLIINAPPDVMRIMQNVIAKIDIKPAQIIVEAVIAEVSEEEIKNLGIQWGNIGVSLDASSAVDIASLSSFTQGLGIINRNVVKNNFSNFQAVIQALATKNKADILSTPSVVVLDNHIAKILVGKEVSIERSTFPNNAGGNTSGTPYATFDRENVALKLFVTPQINQGETIQLLIHHENDTLADPNAITARPLVNKSFIDTTVLVHSGDVLVLGGLKQHSLRQDLSEVPLLARMPLLGPLFQDLNRTKNKRNLMVFIHPVIMKNAETSYDITNSKYSQLREEQLKFFHGQPYFSGVEEMILPPMPANPVLPAPFQHIAVPVPVKK